MTSLSRLALGLATAASVAAGSLLAADAAQAAPTPAAATATQHAGHATKPKHPKHSKPGKQRRPVHRDPLARQRHATAAAIAHQLGQVDRLRADAHRTAASDTDLAHALTADRRAIVRDIVAVGRARSARALTALVDDAAGVGHVAAEQHRLVLAVDGEDPHTGDAGDTIAELVTELDAMASDGQDVSELQAALQAASTLLGDLTASLDDAAGALLDLGPHASDADVAAAVQQAEDGLRGVSGALVQILAGLQGVAQAIGMAP